MSIFCSVPIYVFSLVRLIVSSVSSARLPFGSMAKSSSSHMVPHGGFPIGCVPLPRNPPFQNHRQNNSAPYSTKTVPFVGQKTKRGPLLVCNVPVGQDECRIVAGVLSFKLRFYQFPFLKRSVVPDLRCIRIISLNPREPPPPTKRGFVAGQPEVRMSVLHIARRGSDPLPL